MEKAVPAPLDNRVGDAPSGPPPRGSTVALFANRMLSGSVGYNRSTVVFLAALTYVEILILRTFIETTLKKRQPLDPFSTQIALSRNGCDLALQLDEDTGMANEMEATRDQIRLLYKDFLAYIVQQSRLAVESRPATRTCSS
jgi:hypothetical protein